MFVSQSDRVFARELTDYGEQISSRYYGNITKPINNSGLLRITQEGSKTIADVTLGRFQTVDFGALIGLATEFETVFPHGSKLHLSHNPDPNWTYFNMVKARPTQHMVVEAQATGDSGLIVLHDSPEKLEIVAITDPNTILAAASYAATLSNRASWVVE